MNVSKVMLQIGNVSKPGKFTIQSSRGEKLPVLCSPLIRDELIKKGIESGEFTLPGLFLTATKNSIKNLFNKIIE